MKHNKQRLLLAVIMITALGACGKKDNAVGDTTAMTIDSSAMNADSAYLRNDSLRRADSVRLDSARRADSIRIIDTLSGKGRGSQ